MAREREEPRLKDLESDLECDDTTRGDFSRRRVRWVLQVYSLPHHCY